MDPVELCVRSRELTDEAVASADGEAWDRPTPCEEWSVRDVTNPLVVEALWVPDVLAGRTVEAGWVVTTSCPTTWRGSPTSRTPR